MAFFRPRVGEKEENFSEPTSLWQREQKLRRFRLKKHKIAERGEFAFAVRSFNALRNKVEPEAKFLRERGGIGGEKMSVPATDFERERTRARNDIGGKHFGKFFAKFGDAFLAHFLDKFKVGHKKINAH